jgi:hypothetical protein
VEVVRESMFALLLGAALLYALIGDRGGTLVLAVFAIVSASIAIVRRGRTCTVVGVATPEGAVGRPAARLNARPLVAGARR